MSRFYVDSLSTFLSGRAFNAWLCGVRCNEVVYPLAAEFDSPLTNLQKLNWFAAYKFSQSRRLINVPGNPDYAALLEAVCRGSGNNFTQKLAFVAVNPEHEGQQKFCGYLQDSLGFLVDRTDYRDAFIIPGREYPYQRLSTRITYVLGLLAHKKPEVVVVSDAFDVYYPLLDFVTTRGGRASIAFFRTAMEDRWQRAGLFDPDSPIKFIDLSDASKAILGVDLGPAHRTAARQGGLAGLKLD
jgi:hypothetical protein